MSAGGRGDVRGETGFDGAENAHSLLVQPQEKRGQGAGDHGHQNALQNEQSVRALATKAALEEAEELFLKKEQRTGTNLNHTMYHLLVPDLFMAMLMNLNAKSRIITAMPVRVHA
jgi:hypothetical protein